MTLIMNQGRASLMNSSVPIRSPAYHLRLFLTELHYMAGIKIN